MKIYIITPFYNNSNIYAHLLEHTLQSRYPMSINEYFDFFEKIDWSETNWITVFENIQSEELNRFFEYYKTPPSPENIDYELNILQDELKNPEYPLQLEEEIWKIFYWETFNLNSIWNPSYQEIFRYHQNYCQNPTYIICDNNEEIYETNINYSNSNEFPDINFYTKTIKFLQNKEHLIYWKNNSCFNLYFMEFLIEFASNYNDFAQRYQNFAINFPEVLGHYFPDYTVVSIPNDACLSFSPKDFENFKEYFLEDYLNKDLKILKNESILRLGKFLTDTQIKDFINNLKYEFIKSILT